MNLAVVAIALATFVLVVIEIKKKRKDRMNQVIQTAFPEFEETYISALQSGISIAEAFSFVNDFHLPHIGRSVSGVVESLDRGDSIQKALEGLRRAVALPQADLFVSIVALAQRTGGQNLVQSLTEHVMSIRQELAAKGDVRSRQSAILSVAKLGLLAPWILIAVLSVNSQTRDAFNSVEGNLLLVGGFAVSFIAYRLVVAAGKTPEFERFLGGVYG